MTAGIMADDQARAEREGTGFIEEGARAFDASPGASAREAAPGWGAAGYPETYEP